MASKVDIEKELQARGLPLQLNGVSLSSFNRNQLRHVYWILTSDSDGIEAVDNVELCAQLARIEQRGMSGQQRREISAYARHVLQPQRKRPASLTAILKGMRGQNTGQAAESPTVDETQPRQEDAIGAQDPTSVHPGARATASTTEEVSGTQARPPTQIRPPSTVTARPGPRSTVSVRPRPPSTAAAQPNPPSTVGVQRRPPSTIAAQRSPPSTVSKSPSNAQELQSDCQICMESLPQSQFPRRRPASQCTHPADHTCIPCITSYIEASATSSALDEIKCPVTECKSHLDYGFMRAYAPPAIFERYDTYLHNKTLRAEPGFIACANKRCDHGALMNVNTSSFMTCPSCSTRTCTTCRTPWHPDISHAENQANTRRAEQAEEAAEEAGITTTNRRPTPPTTTRSCGTRSVASSRPRPNPTQTHRPTTNRPPSDVRSCASTTATATPGPAIKRCPGPNCGIRIQKHGGCSHMVCTACGYQFCWYCLASHLEILRHGNHMHRPDCKLYRRAAVEYGSDSDAEFAADIDAGGGYVLVIDGQVIHIGDR